MGTTIESIDVNKRGRDFPVRIMVSPIPTGQGTFSVRRQSRYLES
jgi:hypothetical protein